MIVRRVSLTLLFFFNDTATTEIYTLSLHDALPISSIAHEIRNPVGAMSHAGQLLAESPRLAEEDRRLTQIIRANADRVRDRKSTRLNSSHLVISYAVFCLKKKKPTRCLLSSSCSLS